MLGTHISANRAQHQCLYAITTRTPHVNGHDSITPGSVQLLHQLSLPTFVNGVE